MKRFTVYTWHRTGLFLSNILLSSMFLASSLQAQPYPLTPDLTPGRYVVVCENPSADPECAYGTLYEAYGALERSNGAIRTIRVKESSKPYPYLVYRNATNPYWDTIYFGGGTGSISGTAQTPYALVAYDASHRPLLTPQLPAQDPYFRNLSNPPETRDKPLLVTGSYWIIQGVAFTETAEVALRVRGSNITIRDNHFNGALTSSYTRLQEADLQINPTFNVDVMTYSTAIAYATAVGSAIVIRSRAYVLIEDNVMQNFNDHGVYLSNGFLGKYDEKYCVDGFGQSLTEGMHGVLVRRNLMSHIGNGAIQLNSGGCDQGGTSPTNLARRLRDTRLENNILLNNNGGINLYRWVVDAEVVNNTIINNVESVSLNGQPTALTKALLQVRNTADSKIVGNVFYSRRSSDKLVHGIEEGNGSSGSVTPQPLASNIVDHNTWCVRNGTQWRRELYGSTASGDWVNTHAGAFGSGITLEPSGVVGGNTGNTCSSTNPGLTNLFGLDADDLTLNPTSVAVNRTPATFCADEDFGQNPRPTGQSCDAGAWESEDAPFNQPPTASFTATPTSGKAPLIVALNAQASSDPDGSIVSYDWNLGDGTNGNGPSLSHTFSTAGSYTVTLTVTDDNNAAATATQQIEVAENQPPSVALTVPGGPFREGDSVTLEATASDPDGSITQVVFLSGSTVIGEVPSTPYQVVWDNVEAGIYTLTAQATDNDGATSVSDPVTVTVQTLQAPTAAFDASPEQGPAPLMVTFDASSSSDTDGTIESFGWDFGDGNQNIGSLVDHTFVAPGQYTVVLTVTDNDDQTATASKSITVQAPPQVYLTSPVSGSRFDANSTFTIWANASDSDGQIVQVEFLANDVVLSQDVSAPFKYQWQSVPAGTYALRARATDNDGLTHTSEAVDVIVENLPPCDATSFMFSDIILDTEQTYIAETSISAGGAPGVRIESPGNVTFRAGDYVLLTPGMETDAGSRLHAYIRGCGSAPSLSQAPTESPAMALIDEAAPVPEVFTVRPNYPNPFNPTTTITYAIPEEVHVRVEIFNILGQRIKSLIDGPHTAGWHVATWNATNSAGQSVPSGVYLYQVTAGRSTHTGRMLLLK